jgi:trk system potassium uptake protein TrkH
MKIIIVGAGEVGFNIGQRLASENQDVVLIDKDPANIRRINDHLKDPECRIVLIMVGIFILLVTLDIQGAVYNSLVTAFRYAAFQVSSIITTTGFVTADFDAWPSFSQKLLVLCMFLGAMAGSTGGGIETMRIIILAKQAYQEIFRIIHPHAVTSVKLGGLCLKRF